MVYAKDNKMRLSSTSLAPNECEMKSMNKRDKKETSYCVGCGRQINDQYILQVAPDLEWHSTCLRCQECGRFLDDCNTCFVKDGKTFCKRDYVRLFSIKCDKCGFSCRRNDFVMRAKSKVFHLECFKCATCLRLLLPGDEFTMRDDELYCKIDNDAYLRLTDGAIAIEEQSIKVENDKGTTSSESTDHSNYSEMCSNSETESDSEKTVKIKKRSNAYGKTRIRTVLNEKQLHTLSTFFNVNPRPDALMKEQLVDMTGLSPRVIRVWFQNKRCKHNKKANAMKLQLEKEKELKEIFYGRMQGEKLIATSPVENVNDYDELYNSARNITYQEPWNHQISEFF